MNVKFMQTLDKGISRELKTLAKERRVTVQVFLRAVVLPDWLSTNRKGNGRT